MLAQLGTAAAALAAIFGLLAIIWRFPWFVRVRGWIRKGHDDETRIVIAGVVRQEIAPVAEQLAYVVAQLSADSGKSIFDRVGNMEAVMVRRGDVMDVLSTDVQALKEGQVEIQRAQNAMSERLFTYLGPQPKTAAQG